MRRLLSLQTLQLASNVIKFLWSAAPAHSQVVMAQQHMRESAHILPQGLEKGPCRGKTDMRNC